MKNLTCKLLSLFGLLICGTTYAQRSQVPSPMLPDYNRMMQRFSQMNMQNNLRFMQLNTIQNAATEINGTYLYTVLLKDGTRQVIESSIHYDSVSHKSYLLTAERDINGDTTKTTKIYPGETSLISRDYNDRPFIATATDTCWQFKTIEGRINGYSFSSEKGLDEPILNVLLYAFQYNDGPIINLTPEALEPIIKSDEKAYKAFKEKNYYKAIELYNRHNK